MFAAIMLVGAALGACGGGGSAAGMPPAGPPIITAQPASLTVGAGQLATFAVVATGAAPLQYQWQKNGTAIAGATGSSYTTPVVSLTDNGSSFMAVINNAAGSQSSKAATLTVTAATAGTDVVTYKYDAMRTGQDLTESVLTPANVAAATFGRLRNLMVDGRVDAQPLYLSRFDLAGAVHNVVFVATEHDSVYAFDADTGAVLWQTSLIPAGETTSDDRGCGQVVPEIGITSTPVIDRNAGSHGAVYVVTMTKDNASKYHQRLHALDLATGTELSPGPTEVVATYGATRFDAGAYKERAALLLNNGTIYTSWASHCDLGAYGGWIIAFSQSTHAIASALNVALGASGGGYTSQGPSIWMSGAGPAADAAGNLYVLTGNGRFETTADGRGFPSGGDYGNSFVKVSTTGSSLAVADYFTMSGEFAESAGDIDLGSGGVMLLPDLSDAGGTVRQLAVGAGKDGNLYVVDRNNLGKFSSISNNIWQELDGVLSGGVFSAPAYFNSSIYYCDLGGTLKAFAVTNARLSVAPSSQTATRYGFPGAFPIVSASGNSNGIVWAYENTTPAVLHAYAAGNLSNELYNSNQAAGGRDQFGAGNKFIVPVVADGKVFAATTNSVAVFGLLR